ncbi:hypothetical protein T11_14560 [Trichinella zimbabwensis]|uniref:Uncharacterized protein n=1 Tax=Trichinella zimbabwensis TaxID=268475 RepID=A0A0V1I513_9BILA|nr:hypothetical protein T11_14560 [Trichinella zimbabwensis]
MTSHFFDIQNNENKQNSAIISFADQVWYAKVEWPRPRHGTSQRHECDSAGSRRRFEVGVPLFP